MAKDFSYYFAQLQRIEEHREEKAEKEIRKLYKEMLADTKHFIAREYEQLAENGELTYELLRSKGQDARFLMEVEQRLNDLSPKVSQEIRKTVENMYELAYESMHQAMSYLGDDELKEFFKTPSKPTADAVRAMVDNPIAGLTLNDTLEKNRKNIIWDIKREIGIGLTQGDRYETMAKRISKSLDSDYKKAIRIVRTETGRVREKAHLESAKEINQALENGTTDKRLVKTWKSMKDSSVRDQHAKMDGITVGIDEMFILPDNNKTLAPKQSGIAEHDINCRCFAKYDLVSVETAKVQAQQQQGYSLDTKVGDIDTEQFAKDMKEALVEMNWLKSDVEEAISDLQELLQDKLSANFAISEVLPWQITAFGSEKQLLEILNKIASARIATKTVSKKASGAFLKMLGREYTESEVREFLEPAMQGLYEEQKVQFMNKVMKGREAERNMFIYNMDKFGYDTITAKQGKAWYSPATKRITINMAEQEYNPRGSYATVFHEAGHWADNHFGMKRSNYKSTTGTAFYNALFKDAKKYVEDAKARHSSTNMAWTRTKVYTELSGAENSSVSDLITGLTRNTVQFSGEYGHDMSYYNKEKIAHEAFAHFYEANFTGGKRKEKMYEMFPQAGKLYDKMIEELAEEMLEY